MVSAAVTLQVTAAARTAMPRPDLQRQRVEKGSVLTSRAVNVKELPLYAHAALEPAQRFGQRPADIHQVRHHRPGRGVEVGQLRGDLFGLLQALKRAAVVAGLQQRP